MSRRRTKYVTSVTYPTQQYVYQGQQPQPKFSTGGYAVQTPYGQPRNVYIQEQHPPPVAVAGGYPGQQYVYPGQQQPRPIAGHPPTYGQQQAALPAPYGQQQAALPPGVDPDIASWFAAVDQDKTGQISQKELRQALHSGNRQQFSEEACKLLITMFDKDNTGSINIYEFGELFKFVKQWTETYKRFDADNSGTISEQEYSQALSSMGYRLSPQFINMLTTKFAPTSRQFTLDSFIVSNVRIHNLTHAFRSRDTESKGMITIGYEDFLSVYMST